MNDQTRPPIADLVRGADIVNAALAACTPIQRTVLVLTVISRRSDQDVANELGLTARSVRRHRAEARLRIRTHLEETHA